MEAAGAAMTARPPSVAVFVELCQGLHIKTTMTSRVSLVGFLAIPQVTLLAESLQCLKMVSWSEAVLGPCADSRTVFVAG